MNGIEIKILKNFSFFHSNNVYLGKLVDHSRIRDMIYIKARILVQFQLYC